MYSQNNEDEAIRDFFQSDNGTCLDIGANDGITLSNTRLLIEKGWQADLVDCDFKAFEKLDKLYLDNPKVKTHYLAISDRNASVEVFESGHHLNNEDTGLLSTTIESETKRWNNEVFVKNVVNGYTLEMFMQRKAKYDKYDFINIDAEGMDLSILQQCDEIGLLTHCRCICIEHNSNRRVMKDMAAIVAKYRFTTLLKNVENFLFVK